MANIGSGNGLSLVSCRAITWIDDDLISIGPLDLYFSEIYLMKYNANVFTYEKSFEKKSCKMLTIFQSLLFRVVLNKLRPRQDGHHFPDDIFKSIFLNENVWIAIKISQKFVPRF